MNDSKSQYDFNPQAIEQLIEKLLSDLPALKRLTAAICEFSMQKPLAGELLPCKSCPKIGVCKEPCDRLNSLLPKPYAGKGHHERNLNLNFDEFESPSAGSQVVFEEEQQHKMPANQSRFKSIPIVTSLDIFEEYRQCWKIFTVKQREVLILRHDQGKTVTQIAKELKKWPSTISGILKGAEQRLEAFKKRQR